MLSHKNLAQDNAMKINWLIANETAAGSLSHNRAEGEVVCTTFDVFWQSRNAFVLLETLCNL